MKKLALIFLSAFLIAWYSPFVAMQNGGSELVCTSYMTQTDIPNSSNVGEYATSGYRGFILDDATTGSICSVTFKLSENGGIIQTARDYYAEVWLLDGARAFNPAGSPVARSELQTGLSAWNDTDVEFTFTVSGDYDCSGTNEYAVVVKSIDYGDPATGAASFDGTNFASLRYDGDANGISGCVGYAYWNTAGALGGVATADAPYFILNTDQ